MEKTTEPSLDQVYRAVQQLPIDVQERARDAMLSLVSDKMFDDLVASDSAFKHELTTTLVSASEEAARGKTQSIDALEAELYSYIDSQ